MAETTNRKIMKEQILDFEVIGKFDAWMRKMKNQYYSDGKQMTDAYNRLTPLKYKDS